MSVPGSREVRVRHRRLDVIGIGMILVAGALLASVGFLFWGAGGLEAQTASTESRPVATAFRVAVAPNIDGKLDEPVWQEAPLIGGFVQHEPFEGRPVSERTEVRVLFDDEAIYVGAWLYDSDVSGLVLGETRRDARVYDSDAFLIVLDTYLDRQNAFVFATTPAGIEYDGQVTREGTGAGQQSVRQQGGAAAGFNLNWDGSWDVATSVDRWGWYAEFRIPFSTLRYSRGGKQSWGLNLARHIRRKNEQAFWSPVGRQFTLWRVSEAGTLAGLEAPVQRLVQVTPYVLTSASRDYLAGGAVRNDCQRSTCRFALGSGGGELAVGGDAKMALTPSLTLDLTYNTDFAQVEVDEQQVNLTRFSLFFPEKRPFFLENAGIFSVGTSASGSEGQSVELFFSRRIGIGPGGVPVPIVGGGRLTGRVGGMIVGLLDIQTAEVAGSVPANNFGVARLIKELPNRSRVGVMLVNRQGADSASDYNRTFVVDGRWGIGSAVTLDAFAARTATPWLSGREHAVSFSGNYVTRDWRINTGYTEVGDHFNPEVGFLRRDGYRFVSGMVMRHLRFPQIAWLRELRPHASYRSYFDFEGFNETRQIHLDTHVEFADGAFFSPAVNFTREGLKDPFDIAPGITVPPGTYDNFELAWRFNTNEGAPLSINGELDWGGFLSGSRRGIGAILNARSGAALAAALRVRHDDIELAEGAFETTLIALRLAYNFTPRMYLQSLVQYNSQAGTWSGNIRYGWLNTAGTGLFVVYNESRGANYWYELGGPFSRALIVKFTRQFSFVM